MPRIVMPHEEIAAAAAKFAAESVVAAAAVQMLKSAVAGLVWEGVTKEAFYQRHEEAQVLMRQYHEQLDMINRDLAAIAERFRLADMARLGGRGGGLIDSNRAVFRPAVEESGLGGSDSSSDSGLASPDGRRSP